MRICCVKGTRVGRFSTIFNKETAVCLPTHHTPSEKGSTLKEKKILPISFLSGSHFRRELNQYFNINKCAYHELIMFGFNDASTRVGHFVSSPREREKRDSRYSRGDERAGQGRTTSRNESEETKEIKIFPPLHLPAKKIAGLAQL